MYNVFRDLVREYLGSNLTVSRQFNWRVKGVSMSNFTEEEVRRLQNGGNQVGRDLWLANWSADSFPLPTSGEEQRINKFMQMCFIRGTWKKGEKKPRLENTSSKNTPKKVNTDGGDPWTTDPFATKQPQPTPHTHTQTLPQNQHHNLPQSQPQSQQTVNLLGGPLQPITPFTSQQPVQQLSQPPRPSQPDSKKDLWDIFGQVPASTTSPFDHQQQQQQIDQQRINLQKQQEELTRQQQLLQQQQQYIQVQQWNSTVNPYGNYSQPTYVYTQPYVQVPVPQVYAQPPYQAHGFPPVTTNLSQTQEKPDPFASLVKW
eukprot:TRINITY_DN2065_c0_g1_i25.p1 TRINITY_DN2065_c0_g1~~TRINITY_DN2065_c0_g1_i25.p1  ORF type:complete len:315 (-),score=79.40 TRINITY_DN2065_c0_g1_i25:274-1218(-)